MIKKIDIMGIGLDNYTVRESMRLVETYLSNDVLNTIENISMQMLIASETDPVVHDVISELDLTVIGEKEILKAADADSMQRVQEDRAQQAEHFCAGTDGGGRAEGQSGTAGSIPEADSGGRICTGKLCGESGCRHQ